MAKRGRKKQFKLDFNINTEVYRSIGAVGVMLLGVLCLISFFAQDYTINNIIYSILTKVFGNTAIIVPVLLVLFGTLFIDAFSPKFRSARVFVGIFMALLCLTGIFTLFGFDADNSLDLAKDGGKGGILGYYLAVMVVQTISIWGAWFVFLSLFLVSLLITSNLGLDKIFAFLGEHVFSKLSLKDVNMSLPKLNSATATLDTSNGHQEGTEFAYTPVENPVPDNLDTIGMKKKKADIFEVIPTMAEPQEKEKADLKANMKDQVLSLKPNLPYSDKVWEYPPLDLLDNPINTPPDAGDTKAKSEKIVATLKAFNINSRVVDTKSGPSVTQYSLEVPAGVKLSKITTLQNDLAMALASQTGVVRIEAPIPGTAFVGVEVPNNKIAMVNFRSLYMSESMKAVKNRKLSIVLGKDVGGATAVYDIAKMPHLLIAGATGSGKSIFIQNILFSILFKASPQEVKLILIDPKRVELNHYRDIPHLLTPVVTDLDKAASAFKWAVAEMERRYKLFEKARTKDIDSYNEKSGFQALPYIVVIADELAEIMMADSQGVEKSIVRLAQLSRATGIHLILATQRPSTNIISGIIKANIPARAAFNVTSNTDSRVIIDRPGAEKLLGKGDMLFIPPDRPQPARLQASYISEREIENLTDWLRNTGFAPEYKEEVFQMPMEGSTNGGRSNGSGDFEEDSLFSDAYDIVVSAGKASSSLLQRRLSIGYARAARLIDELEMKGVIGPANGSKPRDILEPGETGAYGTGSNSSNPNTYGAKQYKPDFDMPDAFASERPNFSRPVDNNGIASLTGGFNSEPDFGDHQSPDDSNDFVS